ncbi:MAG: DUF5018 domain-containing protein [Bacteroidales bacterium]|nr:DUF5018 domain-containing protein [Bacteroidales bacterium]
MKRIIKVMSVALVAALAISCYDDAKVWEKLDSLEAQLTELTSQVNSVSSIVSALEGKVYVKAVTEVTGGYEIEFTDGKKVTVKNGKDGKDAPEIGAIKDVDGIYYWTLDGEWLFDASGNKVPAGMGQPKLKTENGQWYISADGKEWALIGPDVACTIKDVTVTDDAVAFVLADGTEIVIPLVQEIDITFDIPEVVVYGEEEFEFAYTIIGGTEKNRVAAICSAGVASVTATDANNGVIRLTSLTGADFDCTVFVTDGVERTIFKTLKFKSGVFTSEEDEVYLGFDAASVTIPVATSMAFDVTPECDWITVAAETRAEVRTEEIVLNVAANDGMSSRYAYVSFVPKDEAAADMAFKVAVFQDGHAKKLWSKEVTSYEGYDAAQKVRLAAYGDNILLANTTKVYVLDPVTGEALNTINMPEGVVAQNVLVDDAGNFMIAADAAFGNTTTLYLVPDPTNPVPEELLSFDTNNYYCVETGNFRVKGNVKDDAVITVSVVDGGSGAVIFWEIVDGEFTQYTFDWGSRNWNYVVGPYSPWASSNVCCAPVGTSLADGLFYIGYAGDYNLKYKVGDAEWATTYVTGSTWMENYGCISTAEWKGNKYAAIVMACHFNYDATDAVLLDVNDPAAAKHLYTHNGDGDADWDWTAGVNYSWTGLGTYSDVLLAPTADALLMVYVDSNYGTIGCVAIQ